MRTMTAIPAIAAMAGLFFAGSASAQQEQQEEQEQQQQEEQAQDGQQEQASQCREDLQQLAAQMQEDGYWLAGYPQAGMMGATQFPEGQAAPTEPVAPADPGVEGEMAAQQPMGPWGATGWQYQPQTEMRILNQAAHLLDQRGNEEACNAIVEAMGERYQEQVAQLEELDVDPAEITAWRQSQIAEAQPVTEVFTQVRIDNLIGTNVRTPQDENLGSIGDVFVDPDSGEADYVTIARGGFFGIGEDEILVPWEMFYATADRTSFVLPIDEATLEAAPQFERQGMFGQGQAGQIDRDQVASFWDEHAQTQEAETETETETEE